MSDIFISYASADRERAKVVSETLDRRGWSVWWDRTIPPGKEYDEVIEKALDSAKCVIVLWSNASIASSWVKTEAAEAMRRKILVPALIDQVKIPLEFRRLQAADLSGWRGEASHPELEKFFDSIAVKIQGTGETAPVVKLPIPPPGPLPSLIRPGRWTRAAWPAITLIGALIGVASGLMISRSQKADNPGPSASAPDRPPGVTDLPPGAQQPLQPTPAPSPAPPPPADPAPSVARGRGVQPVAPTSRPQVARGSPAGKPPEPADHAPVPAEPVVHLPLPVSPAPPAPAPIGATPLPTAAAAPKLPVQEFPEIVLVRTTDGEVEELEATLVFDDAALVVKDEDSNILRTLPYGSVGKATYSRTQRRIMFVRTVRHQLTLGAGREAVVLRLPDSSYQTILYLLEKHTGVAPQRGE